MLRARKRHYAISILLVQAVLAWCGEVELISSSAQVCRWIYRVGEPISIVEDTLNVSGAYLLWQDSDFRMSEEFVYPVKHLFIAVPQGTTPILDVVSARTIRYNRGLPMRPEPAETHLETPPVAWAEAGQIQTWRGFRLMPVHIYLQRGDLRQSERLSEITLSVTFRGSASPVAQKAREVSLLPDIAVNGVTALRWWKLPVPSRALDDPSAGWPDIDLYRLAVEQTSIYEATGAWLRSQGVDFIGCESRKIKLYGNGGGMLPKLLSGAVDTVLKENAIVVEDGGDGIFDEEDRILFFGKGMRDFDYCDGTYLNALAHQNPFTTENIYFVGCDAFGQDGLRMQSISTGGNGRSQTQTAGHAFLDNDEFIFDTGGQAESGLLWYQTTIPPGDSRSFSLNLEGAVGEEAELCLECQAVGSIGNQFDVYFQGQMVSTTYYSNSRFCISVPDSIIIPGVNNVRLHNRSSSGTIHVNYIEVEYTRTLTAPTGRVEFFAPAGESGLFTYTVSDLGSDSWILDVSDPLVPRIAVGNTIADSSFAGAERRYFASRTDRIRYPIYRGSKTAQNGDYERLRDPQNRAGLILLTYDEWYDDLLDLKEFHETYREEALKTVRVRLTDVYDEFGWGVRDPVAVRNFLRYAFENWRGPSGSEEPVKYCLFIGDGDYDYRNIETAGDLGWMPPWENGSDCEDDFFVRFSDAGSNPLPDIIPGRWPVQDEGELSVIINKTIQYAINPLYGPWKNTATFTADDEYKGSSCNERQHTEQAESLINEILPDYFRFNKIYEILYPPRPTPTGTTKPDATRDLLDAINRGTLIINYTGHGNATVWTDEQLFLMDRDFPQFDNDRMWPLFVAATCSWGRFDRPMNRCFPELLLADSRNGGIACVAATRFTFISQNNAFTNAFYSELFRPGLANRRSFGEAIIVAKAAGHSANRLYHLLGNPVLRLATPEYFTQVTSRDDSLQALGEFHFRGMVSQNDTSEWEDFNGIAETRVYDTEDSSAYYWCGDLNSSPFYYGLPGNAIFRGRASVEDGVFDVTFRVPRDVQYGGTNARIGVYFWGKSGSVEDSADGVGFEAPLPIAQEAAAVTDTVPPRIEAWLDVPSFHSGDIVGEMPTLIVRLYDESGINLTGAVGHKITVRIDDAQTEDLTQFFNYDLNSYTDGELQKVIGPMREGEHQLVIEAWDSFNNINQHSIVLNVGESGEGGFAIRDLYNWPNPMQDFTYFTYVLTQPARRVDLKLYTLSGKLVYELNHLGTEQLFNSNKDYPWDGRDKTGHMLANGVYFYRVEAEHEAGYRAEETGKLVILR